MSRYFKKTKILKITSLNFNKRKFVNVSKSFKKEQIDMFFLFLLIAMNIAQNLARDIRSKINDREKKMLRKKNTRLTYKYSNTRRRSRILKKEIVSRSDVWKFAKFRVQRLSSRLDVNLTSTKNLIFRIVHNTIA